MSIIETGFSIYCFDVQTNNNSVLQPKDTQNNTSFASSQNTIYSFGRPCSNAMTIVSIWVENWKPAQDENITLYYIHNVNKNKWNIDMRI